MESEVSTVHQAMSSAILESQQESEMTTASLKLPEHIKSQADQICQRHGVTLSAFLRHCCVHLVKDYGGISGQ